MSTSRFEISVPDPFRLDLTVWALRRRPHNTMDRFDRGRWQRVLMVGDRPFETTVSQVPGKGKTRLVVDLAGRRAIGEGVVSDARRLVCRCLGTDLVLGGFYRLAQRDPRLSGLADRFYGMRPPRFPTVFEALVNAIACQQLSLTVGIHLLNRLSHRFGPTGPSGHTGFPAPAQLAEVDPDSLRPLGFSGSKARAICSLATRVASGELHLENLDQVGDQEVLEVLLGIKGVGRWSAEYTLLRGLGRLQVLPGDDVGARNNLRRRFNLATSAGYDEVTALSRTWWPYGGLVYFHLLLDSLADAGRVTPTLGAGRHSGSGKEVVG